MGEGPSGFLNAAQPSGSPESKPRCLKVTAITDGRFGARHIVGVMNDRREEVIMLSMFRSDWFPAMLAGFAIGAFYVVMQQPALALPL